MYLTPDDSKIAEKWNKEKKKKLVENQLGV
jgi:hypothetical protein